MNTAPLKPIYVDPAEYGITVLATDPRSASEKKIDALVEAEDGFEMGVEPYLVLRSIAVKFHNALDHIAKTARASRSQTRRNRWIQIRAEGALAGRPYDQTAIDLPKMLDKTPEKEYRRWAARLHKERIAHGLTLGILTLSHAHTEAPKMAAVDAATKDEIFQASIDFIGTLTGMQPPPIEVAPPEVFKPFRDFTEKVCAVIAGGKRLPIDRKGSAS